MNCMSWVGGGGVPRAVLELGLRGQNSHSPLEGGLIPVMLSVVELDFDS